MAKKQNQNRQRQSQRQRQRAQATNQASQPNPPNQPDQSELAGQETAVPNGDVQAAEPVAARPTRPPKGAARTGGPATGGQRVNTYAQPRRAERRPEIIRQRKEERRKAYERRRRNWLYIRIGIGILAVLVVAGISWTAFRQVEQFQLRDDVVVYGEMDDFGRNHPEGPQQYNVIPPVGGDHNQIWQNCGFYDEPILNWHGVHSLEHGAVWVTFDPNLPQDQIDTLENKAEETYLLVSPYPGLKAPVVASVWGRQIELDGVNDERLDAFIREYRRNPETTPEQNALCTRGTSQTTTEIPQQAPLQPGTPVPAGSPQASPMASPVAARPEAAGQG